MARAMRQMRWQIATTYTLLIFLTLAGLTLVLYSLTRDAYLRTLETGIAGQAHLTALMVENSRVGSDQLDTLVERISRELDARITLIGMDGQILADSLLPPARYTNQGSRPEVQAAISGQTGRIERYSTATGDDRFYVAVPYRRDGALAGVARLGVPLTTIARAEVQIGVAALVAALLAALLAVGLAVQIARRTTSPLIALRDMAGRLAAGDLEARVPVPQSDEVGALAQSFNQMASRLRQLIGVQAREQRRLEAILATMVDGILILDAGDQITLANRAALDALGESRQLPFALADLAVGPVILDARRTLSNAPDGEDHRQIDELTPAIGGRSLRAILTRLGDRDQPQTLVTLQDLTELRRAERSRRILLTNITHDLRTPLASLQALTDTLADGAIDDPGVARDFLSRIDIEVQGLSRLVDELLEFSRIELGQAPMHRAPTDLTTLLRTSVGRMAAQAAQKDIALDVAVAEPLPLLKLDGARITQVLLNLLQNALTFTPSGGRITVLARREQTGVLIMVQDTGIGIAPADLPHIFEPFYTSDPARRARGVGLGLAIARHLVDRHGGRIQAESALGQGTTITILLPTEPSDIG